MRIGGRVCLKLERVTRYGLRNLSKERFFIYIFVCRTALKSKGKKREKKKKNQECEKLKKELATPFNPAYKTQ